MLANFFKKTTNLSLLSTLLLFIAYYVIACFFIDVQVFSLTSFIEKAGTLLLLFSLLFLAYFIDNKNGLSFSKGLTFLFIVLLMATFAKTMVHCETIFANIFLLFAFRRLYSLRTEKNTKSKIFDTAFWITIACIFDNWSIVFIILLFVAILLFHKGTLKNQVTPVVGVAVPLFLYFTYSLYNDKTDQFLDIFTFKYSIYFQSYNPIYLFVPITIVVSFMLWALFFNVTANNRKSNEFKILNRLTILHLILAFVIVLFSPIKDGSEMLFIAFPFAVLVTNYLEKVQENWFVELVLWLFLLLPIGAFTLTFFTKG